MRRWVSSEAYRVVIAAVVEARKAKGLTQRELAARLRKPASFIAKIEVGERRMDALELIAIIRAIGDEPADIVAKIDASLPDELDL